MTRKTALAFLAHPDDAEILCAGTLIRLASLGWEVHIATATAGDCGTTTESSQAISKIRTEEARRSASFIGAMYHCLGEKDGLVVYDRQAIIKTAELFRRIAPSLVFTHARSDYMLDHEMVSLLARSASFIYAAPNFLPIPVVPGSGVPYLYYCDPVEGTDPLGKPVEPTTLIDISAQMEKKAAMLACHASQREWLKAHHGMDEYIDSMRRYSENRGKLIGTSAAEAFVQHRGHAYPADDLLLRLFEKP
jgi:LmbE family N-acetylglucosaminyl deacetylase